MKSSDFPKSKQHFTVSANNTNVLNKITNSINSNNAPKDSSLLSDRERYRLNKLHDRYNSHEKFIIARTARKTIRFIEKNTENFPKSYAVLRDKIISSCYLILEYIYRANIFQDLDNKKEIIVQIQMLNFYLEEALRKGVLTNKKFASYTNHLLEIDKMVRAWFNYEKSK